MWKTGGREVREKREREHGHRKREGERRETEGEGSNCGLYYRCFWPKKISRSCAIFLRFVILGKEWIGVEK